MLSISVSFHLNVPVVPMFMKVSRIAYWLTAAVSVVELASRKLTSPVGSIVSVTETVSSSSDSSVPSSVSFSVTGESNCLLTTRLAVSSASVDAEAVSSPIIKE